MSSVKKERYFEDKTGFMRYRYNVSCSETMARKWTPTAIDCYRLNCSCSMCNLYKLYFKDSFFKCKMKETVVELVRQIGVPNDRKGENFES